MLAALVAAAVLVSSVGAWRARSAEKEAAALVDDASRFTDMGIILRVVEHDPNGAVMVEGCPPMRVLREHRRGGLVERVTPRRSRFVGPSRNPVIWHCGADAEPLILHGDDLPLRILAFGSMGAGKTSTLAQWLAFRILEATGMDEPHVGATAPTADRLMRIRDAIGKWWPARWWRWSERHSFYRIANGAFLDLVQTHEQSKAEGSKVQGQNWIAHGGDELQDSLHADGDIEARGRSAPNGKYRRFNSVTAKDSPQWRSFVAGVRVNPYWCVRRMLGVRSPFVHPSWWEQLRATMDHRSYQRKVLAMDVGPELMLYGTWERDHNVRPVPQVGAEDVTAAELARFGGAERTVLVGYDPGNLFNVSVLLKAYKLPKQSRPVWYVVDEVTTRGGTVESHARELLKRLRERWHCNEVDRRGVPSGPQVLIRADPWSNSEGKPDRDVYTIFRAMKMDIRPARYKPGTSDPGRINREARIDMLCTLFCNADKERRLLVACDDRQQPVAPKLVESIETQERGADGGAENVRKDETDPTHWTTALAFALYAIEKPRLSPHQASEVVG